MNSLGPSKLQHFAGVLLCKWFEGILVELSLFDEEMWHKMKQMQKLSNETLQGEDVDLFCTRMVEAPFAIAQYKVDKMLGRVDPVSIYVEMKLFIYDAHDTSILTLIR